MLGDESDKVYLFIHGQNGSKEEAISFAEIATSKGWQVLGIDLPEHGVFKLRLIHFRSIMLSFPIVNSQFLV